MTPKKLAKILNEISPGDIKIYEELVLILVSMEMTAMEDKMDVVSRPSFMIQDMANRVLSPKLEKRKKK